MQLKISRDILTDWVSLVSEISSREPGVPSHEIRMMAEGKTTYLSSTNLIGSQYLMCKMEGDGCEIIDDGSLCIPGKPLREALSLIGGDEITLTTDGFSTQVSGGGSEELVLSGMDPLKWPPMPKMSNRSATFDLPASVLREMHSLMGFGCSKDQTMAPMTSMLIEVMGDGMVICTSCDRQRVSFYTAPAGTATNVEMGRFDDVVRIALPVDAASCISGKILSHVDGSFGVTVDASKVMISTPSVRFFCSQEAGSDTYPKMRDHLREKTAFRFKVARADLMRVAKLVNVVASKSICKISFDYDGGTALLSGRGKVNKSNRSKQSVTLSDLEGTTLKTNEVMVSSEDLNEAISAIKDDEMLIGMTVTNNDTLGPVLTLGVGDRWKHIIFGSREVD